MEARLRPGYPVEDLDREHSERRKRVVGQEGDEGKGADRDERCGFADGAGEGEYHASQETRERGRKHDSPHDLRTACAKSVRGLSL